jgi:predicted Zn-dependent peptidase
VIAYNTFKLNNGLRVIHHYDPDSTVVILNTLFNVGARDESPDKTGFAHLFEHLMFGGSVNIPEYDKVVEKAGGSNNAYTTNELTNYYITVPHENAETAFWLESDRMLSLDFSQKSLDVQKGVVCEEFKQRCFNAPFGLLWHHIRELLYKESSYRWPTIGLELKHIEDASLDDVKSFFYKFYHPRNAILCVAGKISQEKSLEYCEKWYGDISPSGVENPNNYIQESLPISRRFIETTDLSPNTAVFMVWRGPDFSKPESAALELFSEMLGGSENGPLYQELVKKSGVFNAAECFYTRGIGEGLFVLYGILNDGVEASKGEKLLWDVFHKAQQGTLFTEKNLKTAKNKATSALLFEKSSLINKAQKLCYFENLGLLSEINEENRQYGKVEMTDLMHSVATISQDNVSVIYYHPKSNNA